MKTDFYDDFDYYDTYEDIPEGYDESDEEEIDEEEIDNLYRPWKGANKRENNLPMFLYLILSQEENVPYKQVQLQKRLQGFPYNIKVGRRAIAGTLGSLLGDGWGICYKRGKGVWYDSKMAWNLKQNQKKAS